MCKLVTCIMLILLVWGGGMYCFMIAFMYNNLGTLDYSSTLNPVGTTSVLHLTQAYIKGKDRLGENIILKYPMLPLVEMKSQEELKDWIAECLSSVTTIYVTKIKNKSRIAYISSPPHFIFINMFPWLVMGSYLILSGTYNILRLYKWLTRKKYEIIPEIAINNDEKK